MKIVVKLKTTTKPKFMHNAEKAGKLPVWTFEVTDDSKPKKMTAGAAKARVEK